MKLGRDDQTKINNLGEKRRSKNVHLNTIIKIIWVAQMPDILAQQKHVNIHHKL